MPNFSMFWNRHFDTFDTVAYQNCSAIVHNIRIYIYIYRVLETVNEETICIVRPQSEDNPGDYSQLAA